MKWRQMDASSAPSFSMAGMFCSTTHTKVTTWAVLMQTGEKDISPSQIRPESSDWEPTRDTLPRLTSKQQKALPPAKSAPHSRSPVWLTRPFCSPTQPLTLDLQADLLSIVTMGCLMSSTLKRTHTCTQLTTELYSRTMVTKRMLHQAGRGQI